MAELPSAFLDCFPDAVLLLNARRDVVFANQAAGDLLDSDIEGRDLALSFRHPAVLRIVDSVLHGAPERSTEVSLPVPVPRTFAIRAIAGREHVGASEIAVVLVFNDVTATRRAEQMRADFVANASHELRSPLSSMLGFIETLKGSASEDPGARGRFLDIMHREALRMARLIDDLLSLSRVEANEHIRPRNTVHLRPILEGVSELLSGQAADRGNDIRIAYPDRLPPVTGDGDELTQVFRNLVENALKYGHADSAIDVRVEVVVRIPGSGEHGIAVHVMDRGDGIPKEAIPRLTERFYRVDDSRDRAGPVASTGLGLAIVKHIVNRHRGRLAVASEVGRGSTFSVYLPVAKESVREIQEERQPPVAS